MRTKNTFIDYEIDDELDVYVRRVKNKTRASSCPPAPRGEDVMQPLISEPMAEAPHDIPMSEPPDASMQTPLLIDDDLPTSSEYETDNDRTVLSTSLPLSL